MLHTFGVQEMNEAAQGMIDGGMEPYVLNSDVSLYGDFYSTQPLDPGSRSRAQIWPT